MVSKSDSPQLGICRENESENIIFLLETEIRDIQKQKIHSVIFQCHFTEANWTSSLRYNSRYYACSIKIRIKLVAGKERERERKRK